MKKFYLFIFTILVIQVSLAQSNKTSTPNFQIVIESLPDLSGHPSELSFDLENSGTYSFALLESLKIPEGYQLILTDKMTGNSFNLESNQTHSFSLSRSMTKQFVISLQKEELLSSTQKELLNMLLL